VREYRFPCCSDTHGLPPPPLQEEGALAWLHAGDFYNCVLASSKERASKTLREKNKLQALMAWLGSRSIPVRCVPGNHDCSDPCGAMPGSSEVGEVAKLADGLFLVSLGWHGECYYDLPRESDIQGLCVKAMNEVVRKTMPGDKFIVLSHWPASLPSYGSPREGYLSKAMYEFCRELKPLAVIEGHVDGLFGTRESHEGTLYVVSGPAGGILTVNLDAPLLSSFEWGPAGVMTDYLEWRGSH
jgi:Icc-related predicted phosphoesterase